MAKKKNKLFEKNVATENVATNTITEALSVDIVDTKVNDLNPLVLVDYTTSDEIEDSEIERLKAEVIRLTNENSELTEKLAEYIEAKTETISVDVEKLQSELSTLQNENDQYLLKISELSFENAKLTAQVQNLSKDNSHILKPQVPQCEKSNKKIEPIKSNNVSYYQRLQPRNNGYNAWN